MFVKSKLQCLRLYLRVFSNVSSSPWPWPRAFLSLASSFFIFGLEPFCPWPRGNLSSATRFLALASDFFRVLGLGLEGCVLAANSVNHMLSPKHQNKKKELIWDAKSLAAFDHVKTAFADLAVLSFPIRSAETIFVCDASDVAMGADMNQVVEGELRPIGFFSKALNKTQRNYSILAR